MKAARGKVSPASLDAFLNGKDGSYHLRDALQAVLDDITPYVESGS